MQENAQRNPLDSPAAVVIGAQNEDGYFIAKHAMLSVDLPVGTLLYKDPVADGWSQALPTEPGLYVMKEGFSAPGTSPFHVCQVFHDPRGSGLILGDTRGVGDVPEGTIWHRLSNLPTPEQAA